MPQPIEEIFGKKIPIIGDTSFFLACAEQRIRLPDSIDELIDDNYQLILLRSIRKEIELLKSKRHEAGLAYEIAIKFSIEFDEKAYFSELPSSTDNILVFVGERLKKFSPIIASGDRQVQKEALERLLPVLTAKNRKIRFVPPGEN